MTACRFAPLARHRHTSEAAPAPPTVSASFARKLSPAKAHRGHHSACEGLLVPAISYQALRAVSAPERRRPPQRRWRSVGRSQSSVRTGVACRPAKAVACVPRIAPVAYIRIKSDREPSATVDGSCPLACVISLAHLHDDGLLPSRRQLRLRRPRPAEGDPGRAHARERHQGVQVRHRWRLQRARLTRPQMQLCSPPSSHNARGVPQTARRHFRCLARSWSKPSWRWVPSRRQRTRLKLRTRSCC